MNYHENSPVRYCNIHATYYVAQDIDHKDCASFALQWGEVTYYLNKLRMLKDLFTKPRIELL